MALRPAVELSYLTQEEQESVLDQIYNFECMPSHAQTIRMRKLSQRGELDDRAVSKIMKEEKPNQADRIRMVTEKTEHRSSFAEIVGRHSE